MNTVKSTPRIIHANMWLNMAATLLRWIDKENHTMEFVVFNHMGPFLRDYFLRTRQSKIIDLINALQKAKLLDVTLTHEYKEIVELAQQYNINYVKSDLPCAFYVFTHLQLKLTWNQNSMFSSSVGKITVENTPIIQFRNMFVASKNRCGHDQVCTQFGIVTIRVTNLLGGKSFERLMDTQVQYGYEPIMCDGRQSTNVQIPCINRIAIGDEAVSALKGVKYHPHVIEQIKGVGYFVMDDKGIELSYASIAEAVFTGMTPRYQDDMLKFHDDEGRYNIYFELWIKDVLVASFVYTNIEV